MGTSTPGSWPLIDTAPATATPSLRRRVAMAGVVMLVAVVTGIGVWVAAHSGGGNSSSAGCLTVLVASSTGGARLHECGGTARALCRSAYTNTDKLALLTRAQCQLTGLGDQDPSTR